MVLTVASADEAPLTASRLNTRLNERSHQQQKPDSNRAIIRAIALLSLELAVKRMVDTAVTNSPPAHAAGNTIQ